MMNDAESANARTKDAWNRNAGFWDAHMDEGNDFFEMLIWPPTERLLGVEFGERILDVACGNGVSTRRLAKLGADVLAFDFSENMISAAKARGSAEPGSIDYCVLDAADYGALIKLGANRFDAALCTMALFDMADLKPLMSGLMALLRPGGRFVFSVLHPCFNNPSTVHTAEHEDRDGQLITTYSVKISRYMTTEARPGVATLGQPVPHLYFHRPLAALLSMGIDAGFVLDAIEERAFHAEYTGGTLALSWNGHFAEIPPVLVGRMRKLQAKLGA